MAHGRLGRSWRLAKSSENTIPSATGWLPVACIATTLRRMSALRLPGGEPHVVRQGTRQLGPSTLTALRRELTWHHQLLPPMYGRIHHQPRLTAVCGRSMDPASRYQRPDPDQPWTATADRVRQEVRIEVPGWHPNGLIANLYRSGADGIDWHADDEPALGSAPTVVSVSYGATRRFQLRARDGSSRHALDLKHGDLLVMGGDCQVEFVHAITKTTKIDAPRLSLTFRRYR